MKASRKFSGFHWRLGVLWGILKRSYWLLQVPEHFKAFCNATQCSECPEAFSGILIGFELFRKVHDGSKALSHFVWVFWGVLIGSERFRKIPEVSKAFILRSEVL